MVDQADIAARKLEIRKQAAYRWRERAVDVAETTARVAKLGPVEAASPEQRSRYLARETMKAIAGYRGPGWERMIGPSLDFDDFPPTASASNAGQPVARIVELIDSGRVGDGFATGFLISDDILLTNWHVFGQPGEAHGCGAQFGYQRNDAGLIDSGTVFELAPDLFFYSNEGLDIALVGIRRVPAVGAQRLDTYGRVRLIPTIGKILAGQPISIIQHPDGGHKRWAVRENKLTREPSTADLFITYTTDTLPGSSGSPAYNKDWELVAVHHSGVPRTQGDNILLKNGGVWRPGIPDHEIDWIANEGARVSKIHTYLQSDHEGRGTTATIADTGGERRRSRRDRKWPHEWPI